ncbi:MAG: hypothetical protein HQK55_17360 [Deltaproteobacteria bacterium]|nr:hypothetical protein [Deltaproteobacteria bacterium]
MDHKSPRDAELMSQGWNRQFSAGQPRLDEAVANYRKLGYEVMLEPVDLCSPTDACTACLGSEPDTVKVIYTRMLS